MMGTRFKVWACGLVALGLAVGGGAFAPQKAQAQARDGREADLEALKKEVEALRKRVEALERKEKPFPQAPRKIVVTTPVAMDVVIPQKYVCNVHAQRHIDVRALTAGYLEAVPITEGQAVKKGQVLFKIVPVLYRARLDAAKAEVQVAQIEFNNTKKLLEQKLVSAQEVALYEAKLAKAQAKAKLAEAELAFTEVKAPFDGIVDRLQQQQGSLVKEGDALTSLSDNSVMWVYFNVSEARYLEYKARYPEKDSKIKFADARIELVLANGTQFDQSAGDTVTVEGTFNNKSANIPFRADFPNPERLLRHGLTGNVLIKQSLKNALVIPQRATFEVLDKRYVYVVGKDDVSHQREIVVGHELDDVFVIAKGLDANDRIVLDGVRQVRDGDKLEYEFRKPDEVLPNRKFHAE
jgi:membrane fusion protein (multidrug efflux system)